MKLTMRRIYKPISILLPFILGMIGFTVAGEPVLQAVYHCICLYGMGHPTEPANILIEIARWLAPLATAGMLVLVIRKLRYHIRSAAALCTGKSVAVYGSKEEKAAMLKALGVRGIDMESYPVKAHSYILLGKEAENLDFYQTHLAEKDEDTYLLCRSLPGQASDRANLHLFCPEETAARIFWLKHCPYQLSVAHGHQMKIILIGFGKLGQELLLTGLQNNVFDANQNIEYHIFGEENGFSQVYHEIDRISDPVQFHAKPWKDELKLLEQAQMLLVAEQEEQLALLRDLTLALPGKEIHVLCAQSEGAALLARQAPLICFDWKKESLAPDNILSDRLYRYAKRINLRYAKLYNDVEETDENRDIEWNKLDSFTRYSNISAADYHAIQLHMLDGVRMDSEKLDWLAELEHIRWCRYHFLNNWTPGEPENGKNKDMVKRIHRCLIPYENLEDSEKEKDRENIRLLLDLDAEP